MTSCFTIHRLPPSLNNAYTIKDNRHIASANLIKFKDYLNGYLHKQTIVKILGPVKLSVVFSLYHEQNTDIDNLLKVLIDCLKDICFEDDSNIIELSCLKKIDQDQESTTVTIEPYIYKEAFPTQNH